MMFFSTRGPNPCCGTVPDGCRSRKARGELAGLTGPQQLQHGTVELMAVERFVPHVGAAAVQYAEGAAQVPEGPAPAGLFPQREVVLHPGEDHVVRGELVRAPFADVHADVQLLDSLP